MDAINNALSAHLRVIEDLRQLQPDLERLIQRCTNAIRTGGRILWAGNGGSAADCQHLAAELVGRFQCERIALPSIALTTDTSILTAVANDYGFEHVFARQVQALGRPGDVLIAISTSGNSRNILRALEEATRIGMYRVAWTGASGGTASEHSNLCLRVPSTNTARIQEAHILLGHILCERIEAEFKESR